VQCLDEGADILDLGAESTRPGTNAGTNVGSLAGNAPPAVSAEEEQARLLPVLHGILAARPGAIISVDTYKAATALAALKAGAEIVNDVSGFTWDAGLAEVCAESGAGVVAMHTRGRPDEWRNQPRLAGDALVAMVRDGLAQSMATAARAGVALESIVLDPGYGFGKRFEENYTLLAGQAELLALGRPLLAGLSRKSFLAHTLAEIDNGSEASREKVSIQARENASLAAMTAAILNGASIVRVHAVRAAVEAARIADAICRVE
jgi:dihydropteroate synthase